MNPEELLKLMNDISYGYLDLEGNIHESIDEKFVNKYILQSASEIEKSKIGVCWDQVEYEREYFSKMNYQFETYSVVYYDNENCPTHTYLIYKDDNNWCWFEHSWMIYKGIHKYNSKEELLKAVTSRFIKTLEKFDNDWINLVTYKYNKPASGINCEEFYKHFESGEKVIVCI